MGRSLETNRVLASNRSQITPASPRHKLGGNWVLNGDFESIPPFTANQTANGYIDGTASGSATDDTYHWHANGSSGGWTVNFDEVEKYAGSASLKLHIDAGKYMVGKSNNWDGVYGTGAKGRMRVIVGNTYRLSGWIKTDNMSGDSTDGLKLGLVFMKSDGSLKSASYATGAIKTDQDWTYYESDIVAPADAVYAAALLRFYGHTGAGTLTGDAWFDYVSVVDLNEPTRNLIS